MMRLRAAGVATGGEPLADLATAEPPQWRDTGVVEGFYNPRNTIPSLA